MISNKKLFHNNLLIVLVVMCSIINLRASELLTPPCSISLTAIPSACSGATNSFSVSGSITFSDAPTTGLLTVSAGGVTQTFYAPFTSSQAYTLNGLTADGAVHAITATFSDASTCSSTISFTAPASCCSATNYSLCAGESYTLIAQVGLTNITWHKIVGTDTLQITAANGQQNYIATEVGKYIFKGTDANGCPAKLCCPIEIVAGTNCPVFDLALKKVLATGQSANVAIGSNVTFTINVINQGGIAATNVQLTDYIPAGLTLNDANWTAVGNKATLVTPIAALGIGQNTNVNITFSVNAGTSGTITNYAEISAASNAVNLNDIDSTPDANDANDGTPQNDVVAGDHKNNPAQDEDDHDLESICVIPSATASALDGTCSGPNYNNDGTITLANFLVAERYAYTTGNSYTGSATYTTATAIPANGIIANNLPNPTGTQSYTIRIFNSSDCYIDRTVTINKAICDCPVVAAPVIADKSRCGTGTLTTTITTACAAGSALKIFSDVALSTDITSSFTVAVNNLTSSSLNATATYYAACVNTTYPVCISVGDAFVLTINPIPTATATGTDGTCSGPYYNNDGTITLANFLAAERYAYNTGNSYTGSATYTTATAIPANGIIANNLPNPTGTQSYTIRIFNSSDCYIDRTVTINEVTCKCPDVAAPIIADSHRCGNGTVLATISKGCSAGSSLKIYSDALLSTDITSQFTLGSTSITSPTLSATTTYYAACVHDTYPICISLGDAFVLTVIPQPIAGADVAICLPKTTYNFEDAAVGYEWVTVSGNPAAAYINPRDGMVNNMIQTGTYRFRLRSTFDITCFDEVIITVSQGEAPIVLCDDGTGGHLAHAPANLSNVIWYSMSGQQVGTGNAFVITSKTPGLEDGAEAYYYVGVDGTATGCDVELCCPVRISTRYCCPVPNCFGVTVIKK